MRRVLDKLVVLRPGEGTTAWLMFAYSFLAMTSYNIVKPMTRSTFIRDLGSDNLPYVQLAAALLIGVMMDLYVRLGRRLPRPALIPATQAALVGVLLIFWVLFQREAAWVSAVFYLFGLLFGILIISQFWTLANEIYDARQARRIFGFIGGGSALGGMLGNGILSLGTTAIGAINLLIVSAAVLALCLGIVWFITSRQRLRGSLAIEAERGVGGGEALRLLRDSRHLQVIALVIGFAAIGAVTIEQQLNMATEASGENLDEMTKFLGGVGFYVSLAAFIIQVGLTSRIHRSMGLTFALLLLPVSLGASSVMILIAALRWAPAAARVLDSALRYSIDKTTREVLFLPLPGDLRDRAKPFVDVTIDRVAKGLGSVALLVLIKPWGLGLDWVQLSYFSLAMMALWIGFALIARREYLRTFRRSLGSRAMEPSSVRFDVADPATIEALVEGLASPDETGILYSMEMLETLDRRHLITPLLLHHESAKVRTRALGALETSGADRAGPWMPTVERMLKDPDAGVRAAAVRALGVLAPDGASARLHRGLDDADPRVVVSAAAELADAPEPGDVAAAEAAFSRIVADTRASAAGARADAAAALGRVRRPAFRSLLVPLIHDPDATVAREAIASARALGPSDALFMPALVSLLGHRVLKAPAREAITSYGDDAIPFLGYTLADPHEQPWVRRHVPATLARLPSRPSLDALLAAVDDPDGFLRYKIIAALASLRRGHPDLAVPADTVERLVVRETGRYFAHLTLRFNLGRADGNADQSLLAVALTDKMARTRERVFLLLALLHPWKDIEAARYSLERGDQRHRAAALEYLDNILKGPVRRRVLLMLDDAPLADRVRQANSLMKGRPRDVADTLAQLVHEDDPVVAAAAVHFACERDLTAALADDLEFAAGHRADDPVVASAVAWARASATRGPRKDDATLPIVELASRLRAIPLFGFVSIDEVFRVAGTARAVRFEPGAVFCREGDPAGEVLFLLDGTVQVSTAAGASGRVLAPAALNFVDMLEGRALRQTIDAVESAVGLTLRSADFQTMLADNIAAAHGLFRLLLGPATSADPLAILHPAGTPAASRPRPAGPLDAVDLARQLRGMPVFSRVTADLLKPLVGIAREVPLTPGETVLGAGAAPALYLVLDGDVRIENPDAPAVVVTAQSTFGARELLTRTPPAWTAVVDRPGRALRVDGEALVELLADQSRLLQGVFGAALGARTGTSPRT